MGYLLNCVLRKHMISMYCKCGNVKRSIDQRYCNSCHNAYHRNYRKNHKLTEIQRKKDIARSYAGVYYRRGKIQKKPCPCGCGSGNLQMHHTDYSKPLDVIWVCKQYHQKIHMA